MKFSPYSISKSGTYFQCPNKFKLNYIDLVKVPFVSSVALQKGSFIHLVIENSYNYNIDFKVNSIFTQEEKNKAIDIIKSFQKSELGLYYSSKQGMHEERFGLKIKNSTLVQCSYDDTDAWYRGAIDYQFIEEDLLYICDWKSGKSHVDDEEFDDSQSKMYAIYGFIKHPNINTIKASFVYVEHNEERTIVYTRDKLTEYIKTFYNKTKIIENTTVFEKKESALCNFCDFRKFDYCLETPLEEQLLGIGGLDF